MTSDGISRKDWNVVTSLAIKIDTAVSEEDEKLSRQYTEELFLYLKNLQKKYGNLPSILATRADYLSDPRKSIKLLEKAYFLAEEKKDKKNMTFIASSLAQLYIDEIGSITNGRKWVLNLERCLNEYYDQMEQAELIRLKEKTILTKKNKSK